MSKTSIAAAFAAAALLAGCGDDRPVLHIYTWSDYIAPGVVAGFEKSAGCKIVIDTFDSNENMYAKLKAGGSGYDIIMPSSYFVPLLAKEKLIAPLDAAKMPNVAKNFDKSFEKQICDPAFKFSVPYAVTYTGIMYIKDKIPAGADVESWSILANPAFKGKVTLLDDMREVIGMGLMSLGYSINSKNPAEIDKAVAQVLKWKANVRKFDAESYKTEVASSATWLGHGYSTDATQVIMGDEDAGDAPRADIGFALPKEGFTIAFDEMAISSSAPNPDLAYAFIDYVYDGGNAKENMEYNMGPMPVKPGIDALDADFREQIVLKPEVAARGQVLMPVEDDPATKALYDKAWDRIKATGGVAAPGK